MSHTFHGDISRRRSLTTDRYTIVRERGELWIFDLAAGTTVGEGISITWPTAQRHAIRSVNTLNRDWKDGHHEHSPSRGRHSADTTTGHHR